MLGLLPLLIALGAAYSQKKKKTGIPEIPQRADSQEVQQNLRRDLKRRSGYSAMNATGGLGNATLAGASRMFMAL